MKNLAGNIKIIQLFNKQANLVTTDDFLTIDRLDYFALTFIDIHTEGVFTPESTVFQRLQHSEDGSTWSDVPPSLIGGDDINEVIDTTITELHIRKYGYMGDKRYIRFIKSFGTAVADTVNAEVMAILQLPAYKKF